MIRRLKVNESFVDERGMICEILNMRNQQVNYLYSKAGAIRGRHYHKENQEIFYVVSGEVIVKASAINHFKKAESFNFKTGDLFLVEPYTLHEFLFLKDTQMIAIYDRGIKIGNFKDIYKN